MRSRRLGPLALLLLALVLPAAAQRTRSSAAVDLRVRLWDEHGHRRADQRLLVELLNGSYNFVGERFSDEQGEAFFANLPVGDYRVKVSGGDVEETTTGIFSLDPTEAQHIENVDVKSKPPEEGAIPRAPGGTVALVDLDVPDKARKEFDKGNQALQRNDYQQARKAYEKAIGIYPRFAGAYNNLGFVAIKTGDRAVARAAFEQAVRVNDHYPRACINLARLLVPEKDYPGAESLLNRALSTEPFNIEALALLADVQLLAGHWEDAIATARKAHSLPHAGYAVVHVIAALAFEDRHMPAEAVGEYTTYLSEDPAGPQAELARRELADLTRQGP